MRNGLPNSGDHDRDGDLMSLFWRNQRPIASMFRSRRFVSACLSPRFHRRESTGPDRLLLVFRPAVGIMR